MPEEELRTLLLYFDENLDGEITFGEFRVAVMSCGLSISTRQLSTQERVFVTLDDPGSSGLARVLSLFIMGLIVTSVVALVLETVYVDPSHNPDCLADEVEGSAGRTICRVNECGDGDDACVANQLAYCRDCEPAPHPLFAWFEDLIIPVFTAEYLARLLTVHAALCIDSDQLIGATQSAAGVAAFSGWRVGLKRTWKFCTRPLEVFDLLAILPWWIELLMPAGSGSAGASLSALRLLRLVRVTRIFKLGKQAEAFRMFINVLANSLSAMKVLGVFMVLLITLFGSLIFAAEKGEWTVDDDFPHGAFTRPTLDGRDREESPFRSIPFSFWWVIVTVTTVGYGDLYPTTGFGKFIGAVTMLTGILVLALPITVVGANFAHEYEVQEKLNAVYAEEAKENVKVTFSRMVKSKTRRSIRQVRKVLKSPKLAKRTSSFSSPKKNPGAGGAPNPCEGSDDA